MHTIREDIYNDFIQNNINLTATLGQNYLKDDSVLNKMKSEAETLSANTIIEIGTGAAVLTLKLVETNKNIISFEIDKRVYKIIEKLNKEFKNLQIINQDFLKSDPNLFPSDFAVVANIPYSITSEIIEQLIENSTLPECIIIMVQKEFAHKILKQTSQTAQTVFLNSTCTVSIISEVSKNAFFPRPKVDSTILKLTPKTNLNINLQKYNTFLKSLFSFKRKKINYFLKKNNLQNKINDPKEDFSEKRTHELTNDDFLTLFKHLYC